MQPLTFAHETERRLRVAFLGTSGHAFRNFLPNLPYLPIELVALWDTDAGRAAAFTRQFGAARPYTDLDQLFAEAVPEAVMIGVEGFDGDEPRNVALMARALEAGCHAWTDKPLAASVAAARRLIALRDRAGKVAGVGIKTMFYPAHGKMREIITDPAFGPPVSFTTRYPLHIPAKAGLSGSDPAARSCLGHLWHPFGTALLLLGPLATLSVESGPSGGGGVALARFRAGTVGTFHFSAGQSAMSPLERTEVVGEGANVVVENAMRLTYYRKASIGPYGRMASYLVDEQTAPLLWEPEMSLGQLYNSNNFIQGYAPSMRAFAEAALGGSPLRRGTLEDAVEILKVYEVLSQGMRGLVTIPEHD
ncbi:MAG: Gfo/Idh/MocA family protein [Chloroflexota bacterium]